MKIAIFHNLPPGGAKRTLLEQMRGLKKKHTLELYEYKNSSSKFMDLAKYADKVYQYDFNIDNEYQGFVGRLVRDYRNFVSLKYLNKKIAWDIDGRNYDVVLIHTDKYTESPFILCYIKTPNIYHCHELLRIAYEDILAFDEEVIFFKKWYENTTRQIRKRIDYTNARSAFRIVTSSKYIGSKVRKVYGKSSHLCHPGVDISIYKPMKFKKEKYLLYIGGRNKLKGYDLVKQIVKLLDPKLKLSLRDLGFSQNETLIKNDRSLAKVYSKAFLTICPAHNEPLGLVQLESMACGTPVLAVNEGGYMETVIDGVTGYLLPRDPKAFAEKIIYLYNHPEVVRRMGKAGRAHVSKNFTWEKHVKCIEKQLYEISQEKRN